MLLVHGAEDRTIPSVASTIAAGQLRGAGFSVELDIEPRIGHTISTAGAGLSRFPGIVYSNREEASYWKFANDVVPSVNTRLDFANGDAVREAAIAGLGVAMLPTFIVHDAVRSGRFRSCSQNICDRRSQCMQYIHQRVTKPRVYAHLLTFWSRYSEASRLGTEGYSTRGPPTARRPKRRFHFFIERDAAAFITRNQGSCWKLGDAYEELRSHSVAIAPTRNSGSSVHIRSRRSLYALV